MDLIRIYFCYYFSLIGNSITWFSYFLATIRTLSIPFIHLEAADSPEICRLAGCNLPPLNMFNEEKPIYCLTVSLLSLMLSTTISRFTDNSLSQVFNGVRVAGSLVFCVVFCRSFVYFCPFSFGHCIVYPSSNYSF